MSEPHIDTPQELDDSDSRPIDRPAPTGHYETGEPVPPHDPDALLEVDHVTLRFGGVVALNDVSFSLKKGEIFGLIGPNGAGKTTCFNAMTGVYRPTSGSIRFNGESIVGKKKHEITRGGIARTSQIQLAQPLLTFLWSALFLGETIDLLTFIAGLAVLACVAVTQRTRVDQGPLLASER